MKQSQQAKTLNKNDDYIAAAAQNHDPLLQAKLTVGAVDDPLEAEADVMAERVMRLPDVPVLQCKCAECEEEDRQIQRKPLISQITPFIQAKPSTGTEQLGDELAGTIAATRGSGSALPEETMNFMESRFGADFSRVVIHTDAESVQMARDLNAKAFTVGNDIYFNEGQYQLNTENGMHLLAHELTHTVQQGERYANNKIMPYRPKSSVNFGANNGGGLSEESFIDKTKQPFIEKITVKFNGTKKITDDNGVDEDVPTGTLSATYSSKGASFSTPISSVAVVGGFPRAGLTDKDTGMTVHRIEGWGYHHLAVPKSGRVGDKWPKTKYFKPSLAAANATMSYALFFRDKEAIHFGPDNHGSLACVHVSDEAVMRQLNYHARVDITKVDVDYSPSVLKKACCQRFDEMGRMVSNPCGGQDSKKCP